MRRTAEVSRGPESRESSVFPKLAAANLARKRGRKSEAERHCLEILSEYPHTPAAHSLLGEIYEDQGRLEDALSEYHLAIELDPASEAERQLLHRALQKQSAAIRRHGFAPGAIPRTSILNPGNRTLLIAGSAVLFLLVFALGYVVARHLDQKPGDPSILSTETPAASGDARLVAPTTETAIRSRITPAEHPGLPPYLIGHVELDPRFQMLQVSAVLSSPLPSTGVRLAVSQVAAETAVSASMAAQAELDQGRGLKWISVRVLGQLPTKQGFELLFAGDLSTTLIAGLSGTQTDATAITQRFVNPWWSPALPADHM